MSDTSIRRSQDPRSRAVHPTVVAIRAAEAGSMRRLGRVAPVRRAIVGTAGGTGGTRSRTAALGTAWGVDNRTYRVTQPCC